MPSEALPARPRVIYLRKSSEGRDAQAPSLDQQRTAIHAKYPSESIVREFSDSKTGRTFDRPGYAEMLRWCQLHEQPRIEPGVITMFDASRFARPIIPGTELTDIDSWDEARIAFSKCGWALEFLNQPPTGHPLADRFVTTLAIEGAADFTRSLRRNTTRGRTAAARAGYWASGRAPFGCRRAEARTGRVLTDARRDANGLVVRDDEGRAVEPSEHAALGVRVVLVPDDDKLRHWTVAARMLLDREPWSVIERYLNRHAPTPGRWDGKALRHVLSNEALIGVIVRRIDGQLERIPAQWPPMVDPDLFARVQDEIARRDGTKGAPERRSESPYVLRSVLTCAHCGAAYVGGLVGSGAGTMRKRYYEHRALHRLDAETGARARAAGCRVYRIPADEAEQAMREIIMGAVGSPDWADVMRRLYGEASEHRQHAEAQVVQLRDVVRAAEAALHSNLDALDSASDVTRPLIVARIEAKNAEVLHARRELTAAEARVATAGSAWERVSELVNETMQLQRAWDRRDFAAVERILGWWVDQAAVKVARGSGRTQGAVWHKSLIVWLQTAPNEPTVAALPSRERRTVPNETQETTSWTAGGPS